MSWTTSADLRAQVQRMWDRGDLLRAAVSDAVRWPVALTLKAPGAADLSDRFDVVRDWVRAMADIQQVRIDWQERNHRMHGTQRLPAAAWIDTLQDAFTLIGKGHEVQCFRAQWQQTTALQPALLVWMAKRPLQALQHADRWEQLLAVVAWLQASPRPGVYLRQVDAPGVDSKFIENHRSVLTELLDLALPSEAIDPEARGTIQFARRFGFLDKPQRIRFRLLDAAMPSLPGCEGLPDITLDVQTFASLVWPIERVFVTENETNFLAFPELRRSIVVFGAGYGWEAFAHAAWLHRCRVYYWGDIDTHGFAILDQLRVHFSHVESFLMDRETLLAHRALWGEEPDPARHSLSRLTSEEAAVHDDLRFDRLQRRLRLEQERIGFCWLRNRLEKIGTEATWN